jgi:multidrug efflux pump subunit AcrA (membrane-fusion protein)
VPGWWTPFSAVTFTCGVKAWSYAVVAAEFNMTVRDVLVKEGEKVAEGTVVANTTSQQVADTRARLTSDAVIRAGRLADMRIRSEVVNATVGKAEHRESVAIEGQNQLNQIYDKGLLPIITRTAAAEQAYNGLKDAESLRAERRALADQITMLNVATEQANVALSDLLNLFDDGRLRAPITGTVSSILANRGSAIGARRRAPVCGGLVSSRTLVSIESRAESSYRSRKRGVVGNHFQDWDGGIGPPARVSKSVRAHRSAAVDLDRI